MSISSSSSRALLFVVLSSAGCAYRTPAVHVPDAFPGRAAVDVVSVEDGAGKASAEVTEEITRDAQRIFASANAHACRAADAARVHVHVELGERYSWTDAALRQDGIAIVGMAPVLFGMTTHRQEVSVDVTVETNGRTFAGHATATKDGGLYVPARRRALAAALDQALAQASRDPSVGGDTK